MHDLLLDIRYSLRALRKTPAFTLVALGTLMLGIGANVVVFGIVNAVLLHPLAVSDPQNLYQIRHGEWTSGKLLTTSYPAFQDLRERNITFSGLAGFDGYSGGRLRWGNTVANVSGYYASGNYFDFLGVQPQAGRFFHATDEHGPNSAPLMVLSDGLWRRVFNADPGVLGTTVTLNKHPFTIVGVAWPQFHGTEQFVWPDYWLPMANEGQVEGWTGDVLRNRAVTTVTVLGRLKLGITPRQTTDNLNAIAAVLAREHPATDKALSFRLVRAGLYGDAGDAIRGFLYGVTGLGLLVLLAACANLASLFAARTADRSREMAVRAALGSTRWRLVRQLITEAGILSLLGGGAGVWIASLLLSALERGVLPSFISMHVPSYLAVHLDARVCVVSVSLTLVSGILFALAPARQVWRSDPFQTMKNGPTDVSSLRGFTSRDLLIGAQIAICMLLVVASLVALSGMMRMLHASLGFVPQGAMIAEMDMAEVEGDIPLEKTKAVIDALRNIPGVTAAGTTSRIPFTGGLRGVPVFRPSTTEFTINNAVMAPYLFAVSPGFLETAETRLLRGRDFSWHDTSQTPAVALVNETFARKMWGDTPAIGQRFIVRDRLTEVVGVVEDGKYYEITESPQPAVFISLSQNPQSNGLYVVRTTRSPNEMSAALVQTLSVLQPDAPATVRAWPEVTSDALFPSWAATLSLGVMGVFGGMLAVTGIFGMAAYNVSRRMKELGIRVALGARTKHVLKAAVGRPIALLGFGTIAGLLIAIFASRLLEQMVYRATPRDPAVVAGAVVIMMLLGVAASVIPALRALAADPVTLLRNE